MAAVRGASVGDFPSVTVAADEGQREGQRGPGVESAHQLPRPVELVQQIIEDRGRQPEVDRAIHLKPSGDADLRRPVRAVRAHALHGTPERLHHRVLSRFDLLRHQHLATDLTAGKLVGVHVEVGVAGQEQRLLVLGERP